MDVHPGGRLGAAEVERHVEDPRRLEVGVLGGDHVAAADGVVHLDAAHAGAAR
jgi:hypothetical protein